MLAIPAGERAESITFRPPEGSEFESKSRGVAGGWAL